VSTLKDLLAEQERLAKAQQQIELDIAAAKEESRHSLRQQVIQLLEERGTTVEELFGTTLAPERRKRNAGVPKYWHDGQAYDGRAARAVSGFDQVRVDGKIEDGMALKAGKINPEWLKGSRPDVRAFVKRFGL
jgi:hypothetical protein